MKSPIDCPFCDGTASLHHERRNLDYRNENFMVTQAFYQCASCQESFTTTASDTFSMNQLHAQYRAKHRIPFPEELVAIRTKYKLAAKRMSQLLGLGDNAYGLYEKGDMPSLANANLIRMSTKPSVFYSMVEDIVDEKERQMIKRVHTENVSVPVFNISVGADEFTGFRRPNFNRVIQALSYFLTQSAPEFNSPLKLNKVLFYLDFAGFKYLGRSLTGLSYRAIKHGPVPSFYDTLFAELKNQNYLNVDTVDAGNNVIEVFQSQTTPDLSIFSAEEVEILDKVVQTFANTSTARIRDISHDEKGWKDLNLNRELISYTDYAFDLIAV